MPFGRSGQKGPLSICLLADSGERGPCRYALWPIQAKGALDDIPCGRFGRISTLRPLPYGQIGSFRHKGISARPFKPLLMYPSSISPRRAQISGPPLSENLRRDFFFIFLFKFLLKFPIFGRSLVQLILAALLIYPFGVKDGPKRRFLSSVPFCRFLLGYLVDIPFRG